MIWELQPCWVNTNTYFSFYILLSAVSFLEILGGTYLLWNGNYENIAIVVTQPACPQYWPQDVLEDVPLQCPQGVPRYPIWPSWGRPDLTSWERPEMTSRGRPNLTLKGRPWEVESGHPQDVLRTSPRGPSKYSNLDVPTFFLTFLSELIRLTKSI